jgi:hypothetical protein
MNFCWRKKNPILNIGLLVSAHELLHALGFRHEHSHPDAKKFLINKNHEKFDSIPICPYDPLSIMHYTSCQNWTFKDKALKVDTPNKVLSLLDVKSLEFVYK